MAGTIGLEPTTNALTVRRSTIELHPNIIKSKVKFLTLYMSVHKQFVNQKQEKKIRSTQKDRPNFLIRLLNFKELSSIWVKDLTIEVTIKQQEV